MSSSPEKHAKHLDAVLTSLSEFYCQLTKCDFALRELRYFVHLVTGEGVRPDPKKVVAVFKWQPPLDVVDQTDNAAIAQSKRSLHKQICNRVRS